MNMTSDEFYFMQKFIKEESGIVIEPDKKYLFESRLQPLIEEMKFASFKELIAHLKNNKYSGVRQKVIDAMTTNETSFFRDFNPFEGLKNSVLPEMMRMRESEKTLNLWSSACSTGQEAYSIAMTVFENYPSLLTWNFKIYASDISTKMIERGKAGCFSQLEVNRGLPAPMLVRYFRQKEQKWCIREDIKKYTEFMEINLVDAWPALPKMDIIFMRHVLIYFNMDHRKQILSKIKRLLRPGGYLILGVGETTLNIDEGFEGLQINGTLWYRLKNIY